MRALGFDVKKADIVKMVHDVDPNNSGSVDYPQFLEISMFSFLLLLCECLMLLQ
jgi:Ca2+-binding EF-hand superfamily protein